MIENDVEDIGAQLKTQREKLGCSLHDVAQNTCIRKTYLESIENNQFSDLPGRAYVIGFVKAYARYLGMDIDPLLVQLEETLLNDEVQSLKPISPVMRHPERLGKSSSGAGGGKLVLLVIAVVAIGAAIFFLVPMFQDKDPAKTVSSQPVPVKMFEKKPTKSTVKGPEKEPAQESVKVEAAAETKATVETTTSEQNTVSPSQKE